MTGTGERVTGTGERSTVASAGGRTRPVLAVVHGESSVSAMTLAAAADTVADIVWVLDSADGTDPVMVRLLRRLGPTVDVAGMDADTAASALVAHAPGGIVAYADRHIPLAASLGERLGLDYPDEATARRLVDKLAQRTALAAAGLAMPRCTVVLAGADRPALDVDGIGMPVVVKPRVGASSRNTERVDDAAALDRALRAAAARGEDMVVEGYIPGVHAPHATFADYVSVESMVVRGEVTHLAVTGRLPPADPFRETGLFVPAALSEAESVAVLDLAGRAVSALGVRCGFLHTEIKLTPTGASLIEVNGRLGGDIPDILRLAAGVDLLEQSQRLALGERPPYHGLLPTSCVAYMLYAQCPVTARRLVAVDGLDDLAARPGVEGIVLNRRPGDELDWREGNHGFVYSVLGTAPDHEALAVTWRAAEEKVRITYG